MIIGVIIEKSRLWLACFFVFQLYINKSDIDFPYFKVHNVCAI